MNRESEMSKNKVWHRQWWCARDWIDCPLPLSRCQKSQPQALTGSLLQSEVSVTRVQISGPDQSSFNESFRDSGAPPTASRQILGCPKLTQHLRIWHLMRHLRPPPCLQLKYHLSFLSITFVSNSISLPPRSIVSDSRSHP